MYRNFSYVNFIFHLFGAQKGVIVKCSYLLAALTHYATAK